MCACSVGEQKRLSQDPHKNPINHDGAVTAITAVVRDSRYRTGSEGVRPTWTRHRGRV